KLKPELTNLRGYQYTQTGSLKLVTAYQSTEFKMNSDIKYNPKTSKEYDLMLKNINTDSAFQFLEDITLFEEEINDLGEEIKMITDSEITTDSSLTTTDNKSSSYSTTEEKNKSQVLLTDVDLSMIAEANK